MSLYLGSAHDVPHLPHPYGPATTACGKPLLTMREITELQASVYLGAARCHKCTDITASLSRGNR